MDELTNPTFRAELIDTIEELASGELAPDHTPVGSTFQIDVGLLLDEAEINRDLGGAIGNFLRNSDEAESLARLAGPLLAVFDEGDRGFDDDAYMATPSWQALQGAAVEALEVLSRP